MKSPLRRRIAPSVPFVLEWTNADGTKVSESFQLSYDFNSLALVEEALGKSMLLDIGEVFHERPTVKSVSVLLWAAVQENHPEYEGPEGLFVLRSNLTVKSAKAVKEACQEAFMAQLPKVEKQTAPLVESPQTA